MRSTDYRQAMKSRPGPVMAACNVIAAAVFGIAAGVAAATSDFRVFHPWLFALGAVAFASNLTRTIHPAAWAVGALAQAICLFELLGFTAGITLMARFGTLTLPADEWWISFTLWSLLGICVIAFVGSTLGRAREMIERLMPERSARDE
jgi:hypothetical protein